ncbi:MAG TPA: hypothetical protein VND65_18055 [Candidatus Binatia bacterium]|nr:hypothetical protein [Candidatus Binatia bacterium]
MKVRYTCRLCLLEDTEVEVTERAHDQSIEAFIKYLAYAIRDDHRAKSPECSAEGVSDVKIPSMDGIGRPAVS